MSKFQLTDKSKLWIKRICVIVSFAACLLAMWFVGKPLVTYIREPERFREWVNSQGLWGRLAYIGMTVLQILLAFIPGEPFEIAGGYAFGAVEGTGLCLLGIFIGSMLTFLLVRLFGMKIAEVFFSKEKLQNLKFLKTSEKKEMLFLIIYMIPGTPKDILGYYAGLTDMSWGTWALIAFFGRIPSVITSTIAGSKLGDKDYFTAIIIFAITLFISLLGLLAYNKTVNRHKEKNTAANAQDTPETDKEEKE